jgi:hypothetical protein
MFRDFVWRWLPWIYNRASTVITTTKRVILAAYNEAIISKEWIFLYGATMPISSHAFPQIPITEIRWKAQVNPPRFTHPAQASIQPMKHISYLGLILHVPGHEQIDITEWVNEVKWAGTLQPSLSELFMLWCCESGTPLFQHVSHTTADIITGEGDVITRGLNDSAPIHDRNVGKSQGFDPDRVVDVILSSSRC